VAILINEQCRLLRVCLRVSFVLVTARLLLGVETYSIFYWPKNSQKIYSSVMLMRSARQRTMPKNW